MAIILQFLERLRTCEEPEPSTARSNHNPLRCHRKRLRERQRYAGDHRMEVAAAVETSLPTTEWQSEGIQPLQLPQQMNRMQTPARKDLA